MKDFIINLFAIIVGLIIGLLLCHKSIPEQKIITHVDTVIVHDTISKIDTVHMIYDERDEFQGYEEFDLEFESDGTKKLLALSAPLVESLIRGNTIFIDELDNSLHLDLIEAIIKLYHDKDINQNNAQLIFSTHNTNLLNQEIFRRDQIWFVEKDIYGSSQLYSLVEYGKGKARDDLALEKNYNAGKFGAKPNIGLLW
jgi:AAA15 family ATPase/GTPase